MPQNSANSQNVSELPIASITERKNWLTRKAEPQLTAVATATARPRMWPGKISLITVHTTGPIEKAKQMMKPTSATQRDDARGARARVAAAPAASLHDELEGDADHDRLIAHADQARRAAASAAPGDR